MDKRKRDSLTKDAIKDQITEAIRISKGIDIDNLLEIANEITLAFQKGNKVLVCGNGGSAADAQHIAGEFLGHFNLPRSPLPAIALTTDSSSLTAIANDFGYEHVFARQVEALAKPGDILIGISTSGNSQNVLRAVETAKSKGALTVGFCGDQGKLKGLVDYFYSPQSKNTQRIQESHIMAAHIICYVVDHNLASDSD